MQLSKGLVNVGIKYTIFLNVKKVNITLKKLLNCCRIRESPIKIKCILDKPLVLFEIAKNFFSNRRLYRQGTARSAV